MNRASRPSTAARHGGSRLWLTRSLGPWDAAECRVHLDWHGPSSLAAPAEESQFGLELIFCRAPTPRPCDGFWGADYRRSGSALSAP